MKEEFDISGDWEAAADSFITIRDKDYYTPIVQEWLVNQWCRANRIKARRYKAGKGLDIWTVKNPDDRLLFALRWGTGDMQDTE